MFMTKLDENKLQKIIDSCEIRTRASEETGALNQRLRPLGQRILTHLVPDPR